MNRKVTISKLHTDSMEAWIKELKSKKNMKTEIEMYDGEMIATYEDTPEFRQAIMDKLMGWFAKNNFTSGEDMQSDAFNIEAPEVMAEILDDIIKFKTEWR